MPPKGEGWTLNYRGLLNLPGHQLNVETIAAHGQVQPVAVKLRVGRLSFFRRSGPPASPFTIFRPPRWSKQRVTWVLLFLPGVQVDGRVNGVIGYSNSAAVCKESLRSKMLP